MVPTAGERLLGRLRILEVALHHQVAAEHDLAHRFVVPGHRFHGGRFKDGDRLLRMVANALPAVQVDLLRQRQLRPMTMLGAHRCRSIGLGQTIHVREVDADVGHRLDDRGRWWRRRDQAAYLLCDAGAQFGRRIGHQAVNDRRPAVMGDAVRADGVEDQLRIDSAQADVGPGVGSHGPHKAPAVAVEHRQRPQIDGVRRHAPTDDVAHRIEIGAAVMIDDALRITGGP